MRLGERCETELHMKKVVDIHLRGSEERYPEISEAVHRYELRRLRLRRGDYATK